MPAIPDLTASTLRKAGLGAYFRPSDLEPLGITEPRLRTLVRRGTVEKVAHGLYRLTVADGSELDAVAATCARLPNGILCLLTALQIHHIGTRLSPEVWIGIPYGRRAPRATVARLRVVRFSDEMMTTGVSAIRIDGVPARITNPARTIIDCLRLPDLVDRETALEATREGLRNRHVSTSGLLRMARACNAPDGVRRDLEVLNA
ncbi:MAG: type IV toxin-antitoxin system AbiEi family antitoxin domain-containing protein [Planctomycetes bacterium]|nr:type IV toxin-antitoxin system AbiEi family antitoxin domain-containing protein [Planctomycetota bacterium]